MQKAFKAILVSSAVLAAGFTAHAQQLPLPGKTLQQPVQDNRAGIDQPAKNVKNVLAGHASPVCPYIGWTLRQLMVYARANHPAIYRNAVALRRTGFTQDQVRDYLEEQICLAEGYPYP